MKTAKKALALLLAAALLFTSCSPATTSQPGGQSGQASTVGETTYTAYGLEFTVKEEWTIGEIERSVGVTLSMSTYFVIYKPVTGTLELPDAERYASNVLSVLEEGSSVQEINQTTVMGYPAYELHINEAVSGRDYAKTIYWLVCIDGYVFVIFYTAPLWNFDECLPDALYILESMHVTESGVQAAPNVILGDGFVTAFGMRFTLADEYNTTEYAASFVVFLNEAPLRTTVEFFGRVYIGSETPESMADIIVSSMLNSLNITTAQRRIYNITINGQEAFVYEIDFEPTHPDYESMVFWVIEKDGYMYTVMYLTQEANDEAYLEIAWAMVESIEFV